MKTIKVNHVVLTLKISPAGAGMARDEVDELVNKRLAEGWDEVQIFPVKTNFAERGDPTDLVQLYIFKMYEKKAVGEWTCPACSTTNPNSENLCESCGFPKPKAKVKKEKEVA